MSRLPFPNLHPPTPRGGRRPDRPESAEGTTDRQLALWPSNFDDCPTAEPTGIAAKARLRHGFNHRSELQPTGGNPTNHHPVTVDTPLVLLVPQAVDIVEGGIGRFFGGRVVSNEGEDG